MICCYNLSMIHIVTAIREEAAPVLHLSSEDLDVTVTGVGKVDAAFAVGRLFPSGLSRKDLSSDILINIGCCCSYDLKGLFAVNKITDEATGRDYYPDMLRVKGLPEAPLITSDNMVTDPKPGLLYEMEASSIYRCASSVLSCDRIIFLKIVSDSGDVDKLTSSYIHDLMMSYSSELEEIIDHIRKTLDTPCEPSDLDRICDLLCASASMKVQVKELLKFAQSMGIDGASLFDKELTEKLTRSRGKEVIARVKAKLIS